jgi:hypothetical protein
VLKFKFLEPVSDDESKEFLHNIIRAGGNTWLEGVLKRHNIPKRSVILNSFRKLTFNTINKNRSKASKENSIIALLKEKPLIFWIDLFLRTYKVYDLISLVNSKDFVIYVTKEDV